MIKRGVRYENLYGRWNTMKQRCFNPNNHKYKDYGGRGITVCDEWLNYQAFKEWAFKNGFEEHLTIDRIDNDGNYEPSNCRWVDDEVQANNKRNNRLIRYKGKMYTLSELAKKSGLERATIAVRLKKGMTPEQAVSKKINYDRFAIMIDGKEMNLKEASETLSKPYKTVYARVSRGWTIEDALNKPIRQGNYK